MGILDGRPLGYECADVVQAQRESDVIFGCVFLGLLKEALEDGITLSWDVESLDSEAATQSNSTEKNRVIDQDVNDLKQVLTHLQALTGVEGVTVTAGRSPQYDQGRSLQVAIAAGKKTDGNTTRVPIKWEQAIEDHVVALLKNKELVAENFDKEFGAYYGIVDAKDNTLPKVISSVRRLIPYAMEGGRWNRAVPWHGLIGYDDPRRVCTAKDSPKQAGSIEPTELISRWNGKDEVCGYCHGMVWAVAEQRCDFPQGKAYELALGKNTHKLSSCFGCSTFLLANGHVPSSMHLGRSDSWVPLPEGPNATAPFSTSKDKEIADRKVFAQLNREWAEHVSGWLTAGAHRVVEARRDTFPADVVETVRRLLQEVDRRKGVQSVANLFLDALTVHDKDLPRLKRFVGV